MSIPILHFFKLTNSFQFFLAIICIGILYLFICHMITITKRLQKKKKCRKKWQGGLKETITIFHRWNKNDGDGYKILSDGKLKQQTIFRKFTNVEY